MRWWRRRSRPWVGRYRPPSSWPEPSPEETVDEALLIAGVAVRLALKNLIIVRALQERQQYSESRLAESTREEILNLADEKQADAERVELQVVAVADKTGRATSHSDFRADDVPTLKRKAQVLQLLASRLRTLADDPGYRGRLVTQARDEALDEVLAAFAATQGERRPAAELTLFEADERRALIAMDLEDLAASRATGSVPPAGTVETGTAEPGTVP